MDIAVDPRGTRSLSRSGAFRVFIMRRPRRDVTAHGAAGKGWFMLRA